MYHSLYCRLGALFLGVLYHSLYCRLGVSFSGIVASSVFLYIYLVTEQQRLVANFVHLSLCVASYQESKRPVPSIEVPLEQAELLSPSFSTDVREFAYSLEHLQHKRHYRRVLRPPIVPFTLQTNRKITQH